MRNSCATAGWLAGKIALQLCKRTFNLKDYVGCWRTLVWTFQQILLSCEESNLCSCTGDAFTLEAQNHSMYSLCPSVQFWLGQTTRQKQIKRFLCEALLNLSAVSKAGGSSVSSSSSSCSLCMEKSSKIEIWQHLKTTTPRQHFGCLQILWVPFPMVRPAHRLEQKLPQLLEKETHKKETHQIKNYTRLVSPSKLEICRTSSCGRVARVFFQERDWPLCMLKLLWTNPSNDPMSESCKEWERDAIVLGPESSWFLA